MKYSVTITQYNQTYNQTQAFDTRTPVVVLNGKKRIIERVTWRRLATITNIDLQLNTEAWYCLYLEKNDPIPTLGSDVSWTMYQKTFRGKIKFIQLYRKPVLNRIAEVFIQSDND